MELVLNNLQRLICHKTQTNISFISVDRSSDGGGGVYDFYEFWFKFKKHVYTERYVTILQDENWLVNTAWEKIKVLIFMQDGVLPYFIIVVHQWLNAHLLGTLKGRRGPHQWPAKSSDSTLCDILAKSGWNVSTLPTQQLGRNFGSEKLCHSYHKNS